MREDSSWNQNGGLFPVSCRFEGSTHGNFCLSETHISANQTIHRMLAFHIALNVFCSLCLIGRVFVEKRGFHFDLQITVGRKVVTRLRLATGIQGYQLAGDILNLLLGAFLLFFPGRASELVHDRRFAVFAAVARNLVQAVDAYVQQITVFVFDAHHFLCYAVHFHALQATKASDTMVDMRHIIARLQVPEFPQGHGCIGTVALTGTRPVVFIEEFVLSGERQTCVRIHKTLR